MPSQTLEIGTKIKSMKEQNIQIFALNSGEPEFDTDQNIKNAAIEAINNNFTKYTDVSGINELKLAVIEKYHNLNFLSEEVIISNGAKHILFNLLMSSVDPNDEVIIIKPYWTSYVEMINIVGGKTIFVDTNIENDFQPDQNSLSRVITNRTKWIILNYPNNPTGKIIRQSTLEDIIELMNKYKNLHVALDEIYDEVVFNQNTINTSDILTMDPKLKDRVFIINGCSKTHSMTGFRIGYGLGSKSIIDAMKNLQSHSTSNACSVSQKAALAALKISKNFLLERIKSWNEKLSIVKTTLDTIDEIKYSIPEGTFFCFPDLSYFIGKRDPENKVITSDIDLVSYLLDYAKIAVIPGSVFGKPNHIRISFTLDAIQLKHALHAFKNALLKLE